MVVEASKGLRGSTGEASKGFNGVVVDASKGFNGSTGDSSKGLRGSVVEVSKGFNGSSGSSDSTGEASKGLSGSTGCTGCTGCTGSGDESECNGLTNTVPLKGRTCAAMFSSISRPTSRHGANGFRSGFFAGCAMGSLAGVLTS